VRTIVNNTAKGKKEGRDLKIAEKGNPELGAADAKIVGQKKPVGKRKRILSQSLEKQKKGGRGMRRKLRLTPRERGSW